MCVSQKHDSVMDLLVDLWSKAGDIVSRGLVMCISTILKAHTDWYTAGKESLCVFRCVHMFTAQYTSIQGGDMDENQTVAGARSLKRFKC